MKKLTFGTPEEFVPTKFCENLQYKETDIAYNTADISFRETPRGCLLEFPLLSDEEVFGFGLQLKGFRHKNTGVAPVRALVSDYTHDENTYDIDDQYMLGDSLMVAPLTEGDNGKRRVYIPEGSWQDYRTGEAIECGWHDVEAKLIPVYKKLQ